MGITIKCTSPGASVWHMPHSAFLRFQRDLATCVSWDLRQIISQWDIDEDAAALEKIARKKKLPKAFISLLTWRMWSKPTFSPAQCRSINDQIKRLGCQELMAREVYGYIAHKRQMGIANFVALLDQCDNSGRPMSIVVHDLQDVMKEEKERTEANDI